MPEGPPTTTIEDLAQRAGLTHEGGRRFINAVVEALAVGERVVLRRLGVLYVGRLKAQVRTRSMLPRGEHEIPEGTPVTRFRAAATLKKRLREAG